MVVISITLSDSQQYIYVPGNSQEIQLCYRFSSVYLDPEAIFGSLFCSYWKHLAHVKKEKLQ